MAYYDIAQLSIDVDFLRRTSACYATETMEVSEAINPDSWATQHAWDMAAEPGFGDAYASAVAASIPNPGRDPAVISDAQILTAVQLLRS